MASFSPLAARLGTRSLSTLVLPLLLGMASGCAGTTGAPAAATPASEEAANAAEIAALQNQVARTPSDINAKLRLASLYRATGRPEDARALLEPLAAANAEAGFHLALVYEDVGRFDAVRPLYDAYLERGTNNEIKDQIRKRLPLLERRELDAAVRNAIARERDLANTAPPPRTVGVFPFLTVSRDTALRPLGTALAELLTTDLAQTDRLRVVERTQVQRLLDELRLGESNRVDPATAARSGRILGASNVVQGRIEDAQAQLSMQAVVVRIPAPATTPAPIRDRAALARIFDLEKKLALSLYERMGVQLTAAERQRVTRHATQNVQALLAFGYGLEASDQGRYGDAYQHFNRAVELDPGFAEAHAKRAEVSRLGFAASVDLNALVENTTANEKGTGAFASQRVSRLRMFETIQLLVPNPLVRDPSAEAIGIEGSTRSGRVDLIIRRPGGQ